MPKERAYRKKSSKEIFEDLNKIIRKRQVPRNRNCRAWIRGKPIRKLTGNGLHLWLIIMVNDRKIDRDGFMLNL